MARQRNMLERNRAACKGRLRAALVALAVIIRTAAAAEPTGRTAKRDAFSVDGAAKFTSLLVDNPEDELLCSEARTALILARHRLALGIRLGEWGDLRGTHEIRGRWTSGPAHPGGSEIGSAAALERPYRLSQLDWPLARGGDGFTARHEIDRFFAALHFSRTEVVIGRQAIGMGRGVVFDVLDLFAPFSPLDIDREWRVGVDAARVEVSTSDTTSVEVIGVFGESWDESALLARMRGYAGALDGELVVGRRRRDTLVGASFSATLVGAEMHAELALFATPDDHPGRGLGGRNERILKGLFGGSYTFDVGSGLTLLGEYLYSGFGVRGDGELTADLLEPAFRERLLFGDTQILRQHSLVLQLRYATAHSFSWNLLVLQSPVDGSGVFAPSLLWDVAENVSLLGIGYLAWGDETDNGRVFSEYGGTADSLFLQLAVYY